ncbi:uncharacterized protein LOC130558460 isoform X2 [Triplophysa rosa]|uniref:uncharacterized protein LOC130558460 isoform X2 n=1 Tax=Triplophysa rosa TaxID=992332 RepID=UPI0025460A4C|nr:uncharacterized protein LOC130558460 isoform X2 [Triplophysa rosa]
MLFALPQLALCLSVVLLNGVSIRANTHTVLDPGFLHCKDSFFRGTPPASLSEVGLEQRCHRQLTGRPFASLFNTGCQSTVYTALHLSPANGWGRGEQETDEPINEDSHVAIPALYAETPSSSSSSLLKWDAVTAGLIRSSVMPTCSKTSAEMYVQIGVGRLNECGGEVLWSAVCCAVSDGEGSFSVGLVNDGEMRVVSIKALEELIGVTGLFTGGCGKEEDQRDFMSLIKEEMNSIETPSSDAQSENAQSENAQSENAQSENAPETTTSDSDNEEVTSQRVDSEDQSYTSSLDLEKDLQDSTNETSESVILKVLSTTISLLYAPFSPIVNRVINFPSQVAYVLQEDLAVLASVPGDSVTLVNNLGSGVSSGVSRVFNTLYDTGEVTTCTLYSCISPLVSSLFLAVQEGFVGMGTLVWHALGFLMGTVSIGIKICWMVLGSVLDQMVDYLCLVSSEMGKQVSTVGCGIGKLTWGSGKGVVNLLRIVMHIVWGVAENTIENVQEAFEESWGGSSIMESPEVPPPVVPPPVEPPPE